MDAALLNPFIDATRNVLVTMAQLEATPGRPAIRRENKTWGDVSGLIGMAGENVKGNLIVSFQKAVILKIVSTMLMEEFQEVSQDVLDAAGEITNMICGGTKAKLSEIGYKIDMATPIVISGAGVQISQLAQTSVLVVPFSTACGDFVIEASLLKVNSSL